MDKGKEKDKGGKGRKEKSGREKEREKGRRKRMEDKWKDWSRVATDSTS